MSQAHALEPEPGAQRDRPLPKPQRRLNSAARAYGDAKVALDKHEGPKHGLDFTKLLLAVRAATVELSAAARAFAAEERSKERAGEATDGTGA